MAGEGFGERLVVGAELDTSQRRNAPQTQDRAQTAIAQTEGCEAGGPRDEGTAFGAADLEGGGAAVHQQVLEVLVDEP